MLSEIYLFVLLSFLLVSTALSSSQYINPSVLGASLGGGNLTCSSLPYPFGAVGKALRGFEIHCPMGLWNSPIFLPVSGNAYAIQKISLQGYIKNFVGPVYKRCIGSDGIWKGSEGSGKLNLDGTPFTLSYQSNTLMVAGCNNLVLIRSQDTNLTSGCVTFCDPQGTLLERSCSGLGCCQAMLPGAIKSFDLNFTQVSMSNAKEDNYSVAFFTQRDDVQLNEKRFLFKKLIFYDSCSYDSNVVQLDWAIGNEPCEVARNNNYSYACKSHSYCYDSPTMAGYLCNCSQGYKGNPYVGCIDIDECLETYTNTNPCIRNCVNLPGNYTCSCPLGMTGDGKKEGSGCKMVFRLDVALGAGLGLLIILVISSFFSYLGLQKRKMVKMRTQFFRQNGGYLLQQRLVSQGIDSAAKIFTENELEKATENYSENKILGEGGFGTVYKGTLSDLKVVAIKKSKLEGENQIEQFINEITILSQINHRHVVKLLGCCLETQVPLLVYEFIPNGTLSHLIQSQNSGFHLPWDCRLRISAEAAGALAYLHSAASFPIIHRDIKSSNILLDEKFTAKVSDFGASRSVPFDKTHLTTLVQGTFGYLDPEYFRTSQLTDKSDVYSFGVVLAELLTGDKPISFCRPEEYHNLAMYFTSAFDEGRLCQVIDLPIMEEAQAEELYVVAHLARRCLNTKGEERPAMKEVAIELEALRRVRINKSLRRNEEMRQMLVVGTISSAETGENNKTI